MTHISNSADATAYRRRPRQERARFTVAAILEATAEVIDDVGWASASTNRIAERAGVSIGSLYQYFPNKEAILASLLEKHLRAVHEAVEKNLQTLSDPRVPLATAIRCLFDDLIDLHRGDPVVARVLSTAVPHSPGAEHGQHPGHDPRQLVRLLADRPDVRVADLDAAARVVEITIGALTRWMVHEAPDGTDLDGMVDEAVSMLAGYLTNSR